MTWRTTTTVAVTAGLLLSGCGGGGDSGAMADPAEPAASGGDGGATLTTTGSDLGEIVVDADGRTVYVFDRDEPGSGESACTAECLEQWPPVVTDDDSPTADGVDGELGTIEREDGTLQVTLDGAPLYLFAGDGGPGDVTGQGVQDVWWVVGPDGQEVTKAPAGGSDFTY